MKNIVDYIIYEMSRNEKRRITDVAQGLFKNKVAKLTTYILNQLN